MGDVNSSLSLFWTKIATKIKTYLPEKEIGARCIDLRIPLFKLGICDVVLQTNILLVTNMWMRNKFIEDYLRFNSATVIVWHYCVVCLAELCSVSKELNHKLWSWREWIDRCYSSGRDIGRRGSERCSCVENEYAYRLISCQRRTISGGTGVERFELCISEAKAIKENK